MAACTLLRFMKLRDHAIEERDRLESSLRAERRGEEQLNGKPRDFTLYTRDTDGTELWAEPCNQNKDTGDYQYPEAAWIDKKYRCENVAIFIGTVVCSAICLIGVAVVIAMISLS